jgi:signal transduction histidine kinase
VPRTIRFRITAVAVLLSAVLLAAVSVIMIWALRRQLTDNVDEGLAQRSDTIANVVVDFTGTELPGDEDLLVQLVSVDGAVIASSPNLIGASPIAPLGPGVRTIRDVPGRSETFRVNTRQIATPAGPRLLIVGINHDDITDPVRILTRLLAVTVPAVVALLGVLTWWLTGRTLRPVETMRAEMAEISETNLGRRLREPATGDEVQRLARTMNQTLDRLEDAVRRQQRLVADASHELRGPLTRMRGELEVDLARPELADPMATQRSVLAEAIGLQRLVEDLLELARSDASATELQSAPIDIDDIVLREARRLTDRGRVGIDTTAVSAANVTGDPRQLARAIRNLLDNAERHARAAITVSLEETAGVARLTVSDDGAGIAPEQRDHIFERFTRLDEARTRDAGGSGLGLAITRDIIERHGGTIRLADGTPTRFVVEIPVRS